MVGQVSNVYILGARQEKTVTSLLFFLINKNPFSFNTDYMVNVTRFSCPLLTQRLQKVHNLQNLVRASFLGDRGSFTLLGYRS